MLFMTHFNGVAQNTHHALTNSTYLRPNAFPLPTPPTNFGTAAGNVDPGDQLQDYDAYSGNPSLNTVNMQPAADGVGIEFFIVDGKVYDGTGNIIGVMKGGNLIAAGASETMIVPVPGNCGKYYIFSTTIQNFEKIPYMFTLDMNVPNIYAEAYGADCEYFGALINEFGEPDFEVDGTPVSSIIERIGVPYTVPDPSPGKTSCVFYASSELQSDTTRLVMITNGAGIFSISVSPSSLDAVSFIPFTNASTFNPASVRGEMELALLSNGNYRVAVAHKAADLLPEWEFLFTAEVTSQGALVPNTSINFPFYSENVNGNMERARVRGLEFSEDGTKLYVTHTTIPSQPNMLEYYDFSTMTSNALVPLSVPAGMNLENSMIEINTSNELMFAFENGIAKLANSNNPFSGITQTASDLFPYNANAEGLPLNTASNLKLYMLPDQIDNEDYLSTYFADVACCISNISYDQGIYETVQSATWSTTQINPISNSIVSDLFVEDELRIKAGTDIIIEGLTLHFAPGARLVIEHGSNGIPGGKLTLDGTVLTSDERCGQGNTWLGVEVWGNANIIQNTSQGKLTMLNDSRIENASVGILVSKREVNYDDNDPCQINPIVSPFTFDNSRNGGIVICSNSTLLNNQRNVWFRPYYGGFGTFGPNNYSSFRKTNFIWDDNTLLYPRDHMKLDEVKGISVKGCYFANDCTPTHPYHQLGHGIFARNAQFYVGTQCNVFLPLGAPCPNAVRSQFDDMTIGIVSLNSNVLSFSCLDSDFHRNRVGIYVNATENEKILGNNFEVLESDIYQTAGLAMYNSTGYTVQENRFYDDFNDLIANPNTYGIVVNSSGIDNNEIYKNDFSDLKIGGQSEGINARDINANNDPYLSESFLMSGLHWSCNNFKSNVYSHDLTVFPSGSDEGRIDWSQGKPSGSTLLETKRNAAGNKFSLVGETGEHDIYAHDDVQELMYVHLSQPNHIPDSYTLQNINQFNLPNNLQNNVIDVNETLYNGQPIINDQGACPSKRIKKFKLVEVDKLAQKYDDINSVKALISAIDENSLINFIQSNTEGDVMSELLDYSPYLPDAVLIAFINEGFSAGVSLQVLGANSPLTSVVLAEVQAASYPQGMLNQLSTMQNGVSARMQANRDLNELQKEFDLRYNALISEMLLNPEEDATLDELLEVLKLYGDERTLKELLSVFVYKRELQSIDSVLIELQQFQTSSYLAELTEVEKQTCTELSAFEKINQEAALQQDLQYLIGSSAENRLRARAHCYLDNQNENVSIPMFETGNSSSLMIIGSSEEDNTDLFEEIEVSVYPNPASDQLFIDLPHTKAGSMTVSILTVDGKEIERSSFDNTNGERLNISSLKPGFYILNVVIDGINHPQYKFYKK